MRFRVYATVVGHGTQDGNSYVTVEGDPPEVWGAKQIADYLGVLSTNLYKMPGLPAPAYDSETKGRGRLWFADDIRKWNDERKVKADGAANGK